MISCKWCDVVQPDFRSSSLRHDDWEQFSVISHPYNDRYWEGICFPPCILSGCRHRCRKVLNLWRRSMVDDDLLCMKIMNEKVSNVHTLDSLRIVVNSLRWTYIRCDSRCISYWIDRFQFVLSSMFWFPLVTNMRQWWKCLKPCNFCGCYIREVYNSPCKSDGWKTTFRLRWPIFRDYVKLGGRRYYAI